MPSHILYFFFLMAYDPTLPIAGTLCDADEMRSQLQGLHDLITALPGISSAVVESTATGGSGSAAVASAVLVGQELRFSFQIPEGQPGPQGPTGAPFSNIVIDSVSTLNPGDAAFVTTGFDGFTVHMNVGLPRGQDGPPGPPFAQVVIDTVSTLPFDQAATASTFFDGTNVHLSLGLPQGLPGEVTLSALTAGLDGTSANSNAVDTLDVPFSNPLPTPMDLEVIRAKLNELILALRR
jgi:hypothetical protein